jgi:hypothetical protein
MIADVVGQSAFKEDGPVPVPDRIQSRSTDSVIAIFRLRFEELEILLGGLTGVVKRSLKCMAASCWQRIKRAAVQSFTSGYRCERWLNERGGPLRYSRNSASIIRCASRCLTARVAGEGLATASLSPALSARSSSILNPSILAPRKSMAKRAVPSLYGWLLPVWIVPQRTTYTVLSPFQLDLGALFLRTIHWRDDGLAKAQRSGSFWPNRTSIEKAVMSASEGKADWRLLSGKVGF